MRYTHGSFAIATPLCFDTNLEARHRLKLNLVWLHHFTGDQTPMMGDIGSRRVTAPNAALASVCHAITKVSSQLIHLRSNVS